MPPFEDQPPVCVFCEREAENFQVTLDSVLWPTCPEHAVYLDGISVYIDPDEFEIEAYGLDDAGVE